MTALRELAERWKKEAASFNAENLFACGLVSAKRNCADELLAILNAEGDGGAVIGYTRIDCIDTLKQQDFAPTIRRCQKGDYIVPLYTHPQPARSGVVSDEDVVDLVKKALRRAWSLGQTYWQQADSESWKQQAKSADTQRKFDTLIKETLAAMQGATHD